MLRFPWIVILLCVIGINLFFVIVPQDVKKKNNKFDLFSFDIVFSFNVSAVTFL